MIKKITLLLILAISINIYSQEKVKGNGIVTNIKENLNPFNKILLKSDFKVTLIKSEAPAIEIETDKNLLEYINFHVNDNVLILETDYRLKAKKALNITIFCTYNLKEIELKNDSELETLNTIKVGEMLLTINDHAKADISVKADRFKLVNKNNSKIQLRSKSKINIESSFIDLAIGQSSNTTAIIRSDSLLISLKDRSTLNIEGSSDYLKTTMTGNTDFKGKNLNVRESFVTTKGSSELSIQTFDNITIEASEKSKIDLYGNPKIEILKFTNLTRIFKKELNSK